MTVQPRKEQRGGGAQVQRLHAECYHLIRTTIRDASTCRRAGASDGITPGAAGISKAGDTTWYWGLVPLDERLTRLITRVRIHYRWTSPLVVLFNLLVEFTDIVMMRKCMLSIKQRVERASRQTPELIGRTGSSVLEPSEFVAQEKQDAMEEKMSRNA